MTTVQARRFSLGIGSAQALVAVAGVVVNLLAFLPPMLGARLLMRDEVGALGALLAVATWAAVPGLGLQTQLAVRWAKDGAAPSATRASLLLAGATAAILVVAAPIGAVALDLNVVLFLLLAVASGATVLGSRWLGQLQGEQRFGALAAGMAILAVGRFGGIMLGIVVGRSVFAAMVLGAILPWLALPALAALANPVHDLRGRIDSVRAQFGRGAQRSGMARAIIAASAATLATVVVSYADLVVANIVLSDADAGAYAVGAVLTKGALWAPQVIAVLALPRLAQGSRRAMRAALLLTGACGAALVVLSAVAGKLAVRVAGGEGWDGVARFAPGFALVGALYAAVYVFINAEIAAGARWAGVWLWGGLVVLGAGALLLPSPTVGSLLAVSIATAALTAITAGLLYLRRARAS